jgi:hypothetical protein
MEYILIFKFSNIYSLSILGQDYYDSNPEPTNFTFENRKRSCTTTTTAMVEIEELCKPEKMFGEDEKVN